MEHVREDIIHLVYVYNDLNKRLMALEARLETSLRTSRSAPAKAASAKRASASKTGRSKSKRAAK